MIKKMKGFTLVELIVVIMIISVLVGFAMLRFRESMQGARNTKIEMNSRAIITEIKSYFANDIVRPGPTNIVGMINSLNINKAGIVYKATIENYGIKIEYESNTDKYSGRLGYKINPVSEADVNNPNNLNDGSLLNKTWFVYKLGEI